MNELKDLSLEQKHKLYQGFLRIDSDDKIMPITDNLIIAEHTPDKVEPIVKNIRKFDSLFEILDTNQGIFFGSLETAKKLVQEFGGKAELSEHGFYIWESPNQSKHADSEGKSYDKQVMDFNSVALLLAEKDYLQVIKKMALKERYDSAEHFNEIVNDGFEKVMKKNPYLTVDDISIYLKVWNELYNDYSKPYLTVATKK